ncbi:hypothetical protein SH139x_001908 [Planctomycetaceae bacterium SH139]
MTSPSLPNAEAVHRAFRGTSELSKRIRRVALTCELFAAALALWGIFDPPSNPILIPFAALSLAVASLICRLWADQLGSDAQTWRRSSLRAYAAGIDLSDFEHADADKRHLAWAESLADKLPIQCLDDYYDAKCSVGPDRLRETYACSAFYTSSLMKWHASISVIAALLTLAATIYIFLSLLTSPPAASQRLNFIDALCSVVLGILLLRLAEHATKACLSFLATDRIADALVKGASLPVEEVLALGDSYDFERCGGPDPATCLYTWRRPSLEKKWQSQLKAIVGCHSLQQQHEGGAQ